MKLVAIKIENFRGIHSLDLSLDALTVLIGENNVGKSTVLEAIRLMLTPGFGLRRASQFSEYDFHLKDSEATPQTAEPISITLHFAEEHEDEWPEEIVQQMGEVSQLMSEGSRQQAVLNHIWLQVKGSYNAESSSFETVWAFLNAGGEKLLPKTNIIPLIALISRFVPLFFLSAIRDASQEFGQRGQFWSGFLKSIKLPDDQREKIEKTLREINTSVINADIGLTEVMDKIADASRFVSMGADEPVMLEALPTRVFDMVGKVQVHLKSSGGAKLPLHRHGEGTKNLAVLMLFQAFTAAKLAETFLPESVPILALEEPEAHLHPSATRSLGSLLKTIHGQILVSSHSGDLVSCVPITALRRLYKDDGETKIGRVNNERFTERELQAIDYSIRLSRGHCLFSRCWLLVEGESDYHLMPLLCELLGYPQDQTRFSVLEISQIIEKGEPLMKLANDLGIQWFLMADGDQVGREYVKRAKKHLLSGEKLSDRACTITHADIEHEFWHNGYSDLISNMLQPQTKEQIFAQVMKDKTEKLIKDAAKIVGYDESDLPGIVSNVMPVLLKNAPNRTDFSDAEKTKLFISAAIRQAGGKPAFARALADEARERGMDSIPQSVKDVIERVVQLAGGSK